MLFLAVDAVSGPTCACILLNLVSASVVKVLKGEKGDFISYLGNSLVVLSESKEKIRGDKEG